MDFRALGLAIVSLPGRVLIAFGLANLAVASIALLLFLPVIGYRVWQFIVYNNWPLTGCSAIQFIEARYESARNFCEVRTGLLGLDRIYFFLVTETDISVSLLIVMVFGLIVGSLTSLIGVLIHPKDAWR
ncbi:hypothetical protein PMI03_06023 [Rhizobium sp. AP16]|nr:hypothetical protein PMI03_06023 [Rhizobium sp. AP16]